MASFVELNDAPFSHEKPHTIVVLGPPRSGTSMIAGILRMLGVYMGVCKGANNEDRRFNKRNEISSIRTLIETNNIAYPHQWGWKEPSTHVYFDQVADQVRQPFLIVCYRNILAASFSKFKHTGVDADAKEIVSLTAGYSTHYLRISRLLQDSQAPRILINYEEAVMAPLELATLFSERFFGHPLDPAMHEKVVSYCAPGSYKSVEDFL